MTAVPPGATVRAFGTANPIEVISWQGSDGLLHRVSFRVTGTDGDGPNLYFKRGVTGSLGIADVKHGGDFHDGHGHLGIRDGRLMMRDDVYSTADLLGIRAERFPGRDGQPHDPRGAPMRLARFKTVITDQAHSAADATMGAGRSLSVVTSLPATARTAAAASNLVGSLEAPLARLAAANARMQAVSRVIVARANGTSAQGLALWAATAVQMAASLTAAAEQLRVQAAKELARAAEMTKRAARMAAEATTKGAALAADVAARSAAAATDAALKTAAAAAQAAVTAAAATKTAAVLTAQAAAAVVTAPFR